MLDDAFMRKGEPKHIAQLVSQPPLNLPIRVVDVQKRFLTALEGLQDAEEKRKAFRETFYRVLGETAKKEGCNILIQGTIKADIVETTGGVKTQHNVLEQMGINTLNRYGFKVVEPLVSLYKEQVRHVARYLGIPSEIAERQPFPGPGLSVRVVGKINRDKLSSEKEATTLVEKHFAQYEPSQYFAAILDNQTASYEKATLIQQTIARLLNVPSRYISVKAFKAKATGVKDGKRMYGRIASLKVETMDGSLHNPSILRLVALQARITTEDPFFTRILYMIREAAKPQPYVIVLRAIQTHDFLTAKVAKIPWTMLNKTADTILKACPNVSAVYYDVTPKPPATIEME
jgi:GMP synthase (glutamine-hydrolysing)